MCIIQEIALSITIQLKNKMPSCFLTKYSLRITKNKYRMHIRKTVIYNSHNPRIQHDLLDPSTIQTPCLMLLNTINKRADVKKSVYEMVHIYAEGVGRLVENVPKCGSCFISAIK